MILSLVTDKSEKINIEKTVKKLYPNKLLVYDNYNELDKIEKKVTIVICEENNEIIEKCIKEKKQVIIYTGKKKKSKKDKKEKSLHNTKNIYKYNKKDELIKIINSIYNKKKKKSLIIKLSILSVIILLALIALYTIKITNKSSKTSKKNRHVVKEQIDYKRENIVFYGDSITDFYNLEKFYPELPVINSGTSGFQTKDLLELLKDRVYIYNPTKVFIMIGTNDMAFTDLSNEEIVNNIIKICKLINKNRPKAKVFVESLYPINNDDSDNDVVDKSMICGRENSRLKEINKLLKEKCLENNITYINMYDKLIDEDGDLKVEYTVDGLHMSDEGYEVITKELMKYIEKKY